MGSKISLIGVVQIYGAISSADEMLTQVANSISANSKAGNTEIMVGFLAKVVDQSELNFVEKSLKEKGYTVEILNDGKNVHIRINY